MDPASAKISGGHESTAKDAAYAASPVTRLRMQVPTVDTMSRHRTLRTVFHESVRRPEGGLLSVAMTTTVRP